MPNPYHYPRPEYPRPDFQRGTLEGQDWLNLNGPWQFRFDGERRGLEECWFASDQAEWREQIIVPFCWESLAAWGEADAAGNDNYYATRVFRNPLEVNRYNHRSAPRYEVGWYRRRVTIPGHPAWKGKRVILHVGAADFLTDAWCNGVHLGRHEGGYTPCEFDLTDALELNASGTSGSIVLRVEDPMDNAEQPVGKQWRWYTTTSGIWQTVFVEPRHECCIHSFRFTSDLNERAVHVAVTCSSPPDDCVIELEISPPAGPSQSERIPVRNGLGEQVLKLHTLALWDPNTPNLYQVRLQLKRGGAPLDTVRTYFGMRKVDFELTKNSDVATALRLNGEPRYLRGALYQSYYPDGVYTATSVETIKNDILWAKRFGFNFLRVHIKIDDPLLLFWADTLGILLMADFPNFGEGGDTPLGRRRFETMMREAIERDFNHPSIFAWCLFNETWGFGGQTGFLDALLKASASATRALPQAEAAPVAPRPPSGALPGMSPPQVWVQEMWELAKELDPTRLVEDMSVCHWEHLEYYQHCDTDINSWHFYIADYDKARAHIDRIVKSTFVGSSFNYVPGFLHKGQPLINSEYGGVGALDGDRDVSWSFKFLTNELRRHQQIAAYIYTELHDVEWEYNGFLNYDRTVKEFGYDPRIVNESNALPVDAPPVRRLAPGETVRIEVASAHYSTRHIENVTLRWALAGIDARARLHQDLVRGAAPIAFPHRAVAPAHAIEFRAPDVPMLCTLFLTATAQDGSTVARNFLHFYVSAEYPAAREEIPRGLILRGFPGNWSNAEWSGGQGDPQKQQAEDSCAGVGHGWFEWALPLRGADLFSARRLKVLCEASSRRTDWPQTDGDIYPTTLELSVNEVRLARAVLRNHPHDARGVLSYLRGGLGSYGYLVRGFAEDAALRQIAKGSVDDTLRLRCAVPAEAAAKGGLTIYGAECGRFPISPTLLIEW